jgi:hypothetical protein
VPIERMIILLVLSSLSWGPNCRYQDLNSRQAALSDRSGTELEGSGAELEGSGAELEGSGAELEGSGAELEGSGAELEDAGLAGGALPEPPLHAVIMSAAIPVRMAPTMARMNVPSLCRVYRLTRCTRARARPPELRQIR